MRETSVKGKTVRIFITNEGENTRESRTAKDGKEAKNEDTRNVDELGTEVESTEDEMEKDEHGEKQIRLMKTLVEELRNHEPLLHNGLTHRDLLMRHVIYCYIITV